MKISNQHERIFQKRPTPITTHLQPVKTIKEPYYEVDEETGEFVEKMREIKVERDEKSRGEVVVEETPQLTKKSAPVFALSMKKAVSASFM